MKTTRELIKKVKLIIDRADWNVQHSGNEGADADRACRYLGSQKFSERCISYFLNDIDPDDLSYHIEAMGINTNDIDTLARLCTSLIMDAIAWDRICRFIYDRQTPNGWSIGESVTFHISNL
jgi:hypothetical protein